MPLLWGTNLFIIMWVARNKNGELVLHPFSKPFYNERTGKWSQGRGFHSCVIPNIYPKLTWEDEPIEVGLVPKRSMAWALREK